MKLAFCNYYASLNRNNYMFENLNTTLGDDLLATAIELKKQAEAANIFVSTVDVCDFKKVDAFVFLDMPKDKNKFFKLAKKTNKPLYLVMFESKMILPENYNLKKHELFKKIFTFDDSLIDNKKYFKTNYAFYFPATILPNLEQKQKLCTLIATNKKSKHPLELYSKRLEAIRWFEQNHPEDFDLYGFGWDKTKLDKWRIVRALKRFKPLAKLLSPNIPSFRGALERKRPILQKYKFAICYENARDLPGYITEKIFDCFFAGCIPVYWGANNILDHIPENCFIDKRKFSTYEQLYDFMVEMPDDQYIEYINNINDFLNSDQGKMFSAEQFAKTVIKEIVSA